VGIGDPPKRFDGQYLAHIRQECYVLGYILQAPESTMSMIVSILITFLVVVLILWLVQRLPVEGRIKQILQIVVIVIGVVALLKYLAVF